ncbi:MAG TPA: tetraacyldisaccharide 4'-kinase [archaeon]|nr:tetraacyldisaccharide 4'-kinase [archaeon]
MSGEQSQNLLSRFKWYCVGLLGSLLVRLVYLTVRTREKGLENVSRARKLGPGPVVYAIWHGRLLGHCYNNRNQDICVMISRHRDGEIIARIVERLGFLTARGSATRGAAAALKSMLSDVLAGHDLGLTVDGPRGPAGKVKPGAVYAASRARCPVVPMTVGYSACFRLPSWDRFQIPRPFCRMVVDYGEPLQIPATLEEKEVSRWCAEMEQALNCLATLADNLARPVRRPGLLRMVSLVEGFLTRERDRARHLPLLALLVPLEWFYRILWLVRDRLYQRGILKTVAPQLPTVCVGSLAAGGTGKTPLTILIAERLAARGIRVAVLTRGYRGLLSGGTKEPLLIKPGATPTEDLIKLARLAGDEAALLARRLPEVGITVCPDRVSGARAAAGKLGAQVLVMDDGFGHRRLSRDMDLLLVTGPLLRMTGHVLPAGYLREPYAAAGRARAVVYIGTQDTTGPEAETPRIPWAKDKEIIRFYRKARLLVPLGLWLAGAMHGKSKNSEKKFLNPETALKGKKVLAFCGIAHPESFRDALAGFVPQWLELTAFSDHCAYSRRLQLTLRQRAGKAGALLVTTEKDAVKLDPELIGSDCLVLGLELQEAAPGALDRLLDELPGGL